MDEISELIQTNGQIDHKAYRYKVNAGKESFMITVIATNSTTASEALKKQLPAESIIHYDGVSTKIMQVQ